MSEYLSPSSEIKPLYIRQVEDVRNFGNVSVKPMLAGEQMTLLEITYPPGAGAPPHVHQHETLCYVVSGRVEVRVADDVFEMGPGDTCIHPQGVPHGIKGVEHAVVIEVKSPAQPVSQFLGLSHD
ncbi:MAG: cupin domain-containing protein [Actinobacteria bacterium]|nr:cupin domain-containing protein [Actinomycetota bacterium]MCI0678257.1 cupin domain-containing protein [Actinomycetota bacterium]